MANSACDGSLRSDDIGADNTFYFSVDNKKTADRIKDAMASSSVVNLAYEQKLFPLSWALPGTCQRRTQYEVHDVQTLNGLPRQPPLAPAKR